MKYLFPALLLVALCSYGQQNKQPENATDNPVLTSTLALSLLEKNCYACHNPNTKSHDEILAPPLAGIKMRYLKSSADRNDFVEKMSAFVENPTEAQALMKGPIRRFGVMPKPAVTKEEINAIVQYIYDNQLQEPVWFADHHKDKKSH